MSQKREGSPTLADIRATREAFPPSLVHTTPLELHERLSRIHHHPVYLKREDQQTVRSYKVRGAAAKMLALSEETLSKGIVCASAGNHAQGVAACCDLLETPGTIFMPRTTPSQKIDATSRRGNAHVTIRLEGDIFDETAQHAQNFAREYHATFIHPFDDWEVIAGQGTVALEIGDQLAGIRGKLGAVLVPVGGGGLLAGTVLALRETHPDAKIIGVEPDGAASMAASIQNGKPTKLQGIDTFVDGAAVAQPGSKPFDVIAQAIQEGRVLLASIDNNRLCDTMAALLQIEGHVTEPAGALSIAALGEVPLPTRNNAIVVSIVSGGNLDMCRMPRILEHAELHRRTKIFLRITLPDRPQALLEMLQAAVAANPNINICYMQFDEDQENGTSPPLVVGFQSKIGDSRDIVALLAALQHRYSYEELREKPR